MKRLFITLIAMLTMGQMAHADDQAPLWLRHQQISPDGTTIAFCYRGDIYTIPVTGGVARRLTAHPAYDGSPIWSPDSKHIAFSSNRNGSDDLYIIGAQGGEPQRLTYNSDQEKPVAFINDTTILFEGHVLPDAQFDQFPYRGFGQLYTIGMNGGRPHLFSSLPMEQISIHHGQILYTDFKGYEDPWRKHQQASISRDIWLRSADGKSYSKLTDFVGEDRNAVWHPDGKGFYYLSEKDGCSNIYYRSDLSSKSTDTQLTHYTQNPVRFLSIARDGKLCYGYDGEIYTYSPQLPQPQKVSIQIFADNGEQEIIHKRLTSGVTSFAMSPNNKEAAFVMRGDVYVANVEFGTVKQITNTPEQERSVDFASDGRRLIYASERNGCWNIYMSEIARQEDPLFCYANEIKEKRLTNETQFPCFQPLFSPNGKRIAFLRNRTEIVTLDLESGQERTVRPQSGAYSYQDGDQSYSWSPDGKWIIANYIGDGGWNNQDCAIFSTEGADEYVNLTRSGYNERLGKFVLGGKAVLFTSDRSGMRSHGSWGAERDLYLMFLDRKAYDHFNLTKEQRELRKELEKARKEDNDQTKKKDSKKADKEKKSDKVQPITLELNGRDDRTIRLTRVSGHIGDAVMNEDGTKLYYIAQYEKTPDLWVKDLVDKSTKKLASSIGYGSLVLGKDGKTLYLGSSNGLSKIAENGSIKKTNITAAFELKPAAERTYIFDHIWHQVRDKFYDVNLHGVDWEGYRKIYSKFLPYINNDRDFAEMLSEMLGELNASHTGARYFESHSATATAAFGVFYDPTYRGDGLKIAEIMEGSPLAYADSKIKAGMVITHIDGEQLKANEPVEPLLNGKVNKRVLLTVRDPKTGINVDETVRPISQSSQYELRYRRWLKQREDKVREWSDGKIGYVYVRSMDSPSFRTVFQELLGKYRSCDAVVVDTRYNGGGWLHEDLVILLSGQKYMTFNPRGQYIGSDPFMQWNKPSCVLMSEGNYSNGSGFPWVYQQLKMGKLIGTPVPGTMTAVWWERQINPQIVFGIPQVTCSDMDGKPLENQEVYPDITIYNTPEDYLNGRDPQLKRAVEEMQKEISNK